MGKYFVKIGVLFVLSLLPKYLTVDDVRTSPFFAGESKDSFKKVVENLIKNQLPPDLPPLPTIKEPVAEVQPTYREVA